MEENKVLLTIVVQRKDGNRAVDAAVKAGAPGVTYFYARGTGVRQKLGFLGYLIEAEKQVIKIVLPAADADRVLDIVIKETGLDKPGKGFAYITPVNRVIGFYTE